MPTPGTLDPQNVHWKCQSLMSLEIKNSGYEVINTAILIEQTTAGQLAIENKSIAMVKHWQTPGKKTLGLHLPLSMKLIFKWFQVDGNWKNPTFDAEAPRLPSVVGRAGPLSKGLLAGRHFVRSHGWFGSVFLAAFSLNSGSLSMTCLYKTDLLGENHHLRFSRGKFIII